MIKNFKFLFLNLIIFGFANTARAEGESVIPITDKVKTNLGTLENNVLGGEPIEPQIIAANIIEVALGIIGIVFVTLMIYGGYKWMLARGNEEQAEKARDTIKQAVIGVIIVFFAYFITAFVIQRLGESAFNPFVAY